MDSLNLKKRQLARQADARRFEDLQHSFLTTIERLKHAHTFHERIQLTYHLQQITREQKELFAALVRGRSQITFGGRGGRHR